MSESLFTWMMAEELAAAHMKAIGFTDARRTKAGADGGIDVTSKNAVAQVKHHAQPVGIAEMQRLKGIVHDGRQALFYSFKGYTNGALTFASRAGLALFTFDESNRVRAANDSARLLERKPEPTPSSQSSLTPDQRQAHTRALLLTVWRCYYMLEPLETHVRRMITGRWKWEEDRQARPAAFEDFKDFAERAWPRLKTDLSSAMNASKVDGSDVKAIHADVYKKVQEFLAQGRRVGIESETYMPRVAEMEWSGTEWVRRGHKAASTPQ